MPRYRTPNTLQDISLRIAAGTFIKMVKKLIYPDGAGFSPPRSLSTDCIERIRQDIYANVPSCLHNKFSSILLEETLSMGDLIARYQMKRISIYPKMTSFFIDDVLEEQGICKYLSETTDLKTIHMNIEDDSLHHKLTDVEIETIVAEVSSLSNITCFTFMFNCTNEVLSAVAESCPRLAELNIYSSWEVTECSSLLKLPHLKKIDLGLTSVGDNGIAEILLHNDNLIMLYGATGDALELYHEKSNQHQPRMNEFGSYSITTQSLKTLVTIFPNITNLSISSDDDYQLDLTALLFLKNLRSLSLDGAVFDIENLENYLKSAGSSIINISLCHIGGIDLYVIKILGEFCSNLESLEIKDVNFMLKAPRHFVKENLRPFHRLERLLIDSEFAPITYVAPIEYILKNCTNLKRVGLYSGTNVIEQALRRNELPNLICLDIVDTSSTNRGLTINFARLVLEKCPHIRELSDLANWPGVTTVDLRNFKRELLMNNVDIRIDEVQLI